MFSRTIYRSLECVCITSSVFCLCESDRNIRLCSDCCLFFSSSSNHSKFSKHRTNQHTNARKFWTQQLEFRTIFVWPFIFPIRQSSTWCVCVNVNVCSCVCVNSYGMIFAVHYVPIRFLICSTHHSYTIVRTIFHRVSVSINFCIFVLFLVSVKMWPLMFGHTHTIFTPSHSFFLSINEYRKCSCNKRTIITITE